MHGYMCGGDAQFDPETILKEDLDSIVLECFEAGKPVENFFNELINRR